MNKDLIEECFLQSLRAAPLPTTEEWEDIVETDEVLEDPLDYSDWENYYKDLSTWGGWE